MMHVPFFDEKEINVVHYWAPKDHYITNIIDRFGFLDSYKVVFIWFAQRLDQDILDKINKVPRDRVFFQLEDVDWI